MKFIGIKTVCRMTGLSKSTILRKMKDGTFPKSFSLGTKNCVRWVRDEVLEWMKSQVEGDEAGASENELAEKLDEILIVLKQLRDMWK